MRQFLALSLIVINLIAFTACSGNKVFSPEHVVGDRDTLDGYEEDLFMQHREGVTFENGVFLTKDGLFDTFKLPKSFAYLNESNSSIIAADNAGKVLIKSKDGESEQTLILSDRILSASIEGDLLAVVTVRNQAKIFSLKTEKELFTFSGSSVMAIDARLAPPKFYEGLIFFPSLDGKIQIYSKAAKKMIRTMSVSTQEQFNNIIFFDVIDKKLLAATGSTVYLFSRKSAQKKIPVKEIFLSDEQIIVLRKDGRIVSLDLDLEVKHELKYPFARFLGGISTKEAIFVVEREGYLIKIRKDFALGLVYLLDFDADLFFAGNKSFYFSDGYYTP